MDKTNLIDLEAFKHDKEKETMEVRLARLWATASKKFFPTTLLQRELELVGATPYEGLTTGGAITLFMMESANYVKPCGPTAAFDQKVHEGDIKICIDHVEVKGVKVFPEAGSLVELDSHARTAQDCATILAQHTAVTGKDKRIVQTCDIDECLKVRIPYINAIGLRKILGESTTDVMKARDEFFAKFMRKSNYPFLIYSVSVLYSTPMLAPYRRESKIMLDSYRKKILEQSQVKSTDWWKLPDIQEAYTLCPGPFYYKVGLATEMIWRFYHASIEAIGEAGEFGPLSKGYYRYDMSSFFLDDIDQATDVIMISQKFGYPSVTLKEANVRLAAILIRNGITVYCSAMTSKRQCQGRIGVYARGDLKTFVYYETRQVRPRLCRYGISMPTPEPIQSTQPTYVLEYIPNIETNGNRYLPSCRVSQGYCIKTNCLSRGIDLTVLRDRFLKAIWYRNWYIYTRYTFVAQDPFQSWFDTAWYYPCASEKLERDVFDHLGYNEDRGVKVKLLSVKLICGIGDEAPIYEDVGSLTLEEQDDIITYMEKMSHGDLVVLEDLVINAMVPCTHRVFPLYQHWTQREMLDRVQQIMIDNPDPDSSYEYFGEDDEYVDVFQYGDDCVHFPK
jgi:hypothetical protein